MKYVKDTLWSKTEKEKFKSLVYRWCEVVILLLTKDEGEFF